MLPGIVKPGVGDEDGCHRISSGTELHKHLSLAQVLATPLNILFAWPPLQPTWCTISESCELMILTASEIMQQTAIAIATQCAGLCLTQDRSSCKQQLKIKQASLGTRQSSETPRALYTERPQEYCCLASKRSDAAFFKQWLSAAKALFRTS